VLAVLQVNSRALAEACLVCRKLCLQVIAALPNVCNYLHMPAQSGSSSMLQRMKRGYTREAYDALVQRARDVIPNVALSTDMITGTGCQLLATCPLADGIEALP
jgi:hypothetical protein